MPGRHPIKLGAQEVTAEIQFGCGFDAGDSFRRGAPATLCNTVESTGSLAALRLRGKPCDLARFHFVCGVLAVHGYTCA